GQVVLVSGRDRKTLERWFNRKFNLVAEHGAWIKEAGKPWFKVEELDVGWKEELRPIFELFTERVPGSFTEEKEFSLVWHYRKADPVWGSLKAGELANILRTLTANTGLQVFQGSKTVEVKDMKVGKGRAVLHWLAKRKWDFILAMGDDWTDEEMFKVLPEQAYTIRIGFSPSKARFHLKSYREARRLLKGLIEASKTFKPQLLTA
ncbi:MAG: trehalose-phosphatase, partial [Candidatus Hecatellaceae archaeon]